jgi:GNAT superfamily N-acetyltransferase
MDIGPATRDALDQLLAIDDHQGRREHVLQRWERQNAGDLFLLASVDGELVGHTMLFRQSKYPAIDAAYGPAEINALHAYVHGQGIGTAIIAAAEQFARQWGKTHIGLAVEPDNDGARRLYDRLGYRPCPDGRVIDEWTEKDADGNLIELHQDPCDYLLKPLAKAFPHD